jgi:hypothetical protein
MTSNSASVTGQPESSNSGLLSTPFEDDLNRLERRTVVEPDWRARMWRRSYCVALNAISALEKRIARDRSQSWDAPMVFFYPDERSDP